MSIQDQPPPSPGEGDLWLDVIHDMEERRQVGIVRYGTPLQAFNGRDALVDAYQEALDLVVYLRQAIKERKIDACEELVRLRSRETVREAWERCEGEPTHIGAAAETWRYVAKAIGRCELPPGPGPKVYRP